MVRGTEAQNVSVSTKEERDIRSVAEAINALLVR